MNMPGQLALVAAGGASGALARYGVSLWMRTADRTSFPYATLTVNVIGSLLAGILLVLYTQTAPNNAGLRLFGAVGFLGAFTTFSAFSVETMLLLEAGNWSVAGVNIALNILLCLILCGLGIALARACLV